MLDLDAAQLGAAERPGEGQQQHRPVTQSGETVLAGGNELLEIIDVQRLRPLGRTAVSAIDPAQDVTDRGMTCIERLTG